MDLLTILSGNDIPFVKGGFVIHQPTIKEIALIGEESFYTGCEFLRFSKELLNDEDKNNLKDKTDFDILMIILQEKNNVSIKGRICLELVFSLIFPSYKVRIESDKILLSKDENEQYVLDNSNFIDFKEIINEIFCLKQSNDKEYNPAGDMAKKISEKLKNRHKKLAQLKNETNINNILGRFVSILAVGESKDMNNLFNYTIYQLFDEHKRYSLKLSHDLMIQAKLAGAKQDEKVENWMEDIHSTKEENK